MAQQPVTDRMQALVQQWVEASDRRAIFLHCYMLMTHNMLVAIDSDEFNDDEWVYTLLHRFADYYFDALNAYEQESPATPAVWRNAFDATREARTMVLQNLMLGVNAHINYDLVFTLVDMLEDEWAELSDARRSRRYEDHCHVNFVIGRTIDTVQDTVIERLSPQMDIADKLLGPLDEWLTSRLISHWRDEVWHNAVQILDAPEKEQCDRLCRRIEKTTLERANVILLEDGPSSLVHLL